MKLFQERVLKLVYIPRLVLWKIMNKILRKEIISNNQVKKKETPLPVPTKVFPLGYMNSNSVQECSWDDGVVTIFLPFCWLFFTNLPYKPILSADVQDFMGRSQKAHRSGGLLDRHRRQSLWPIVVHETTSGREMDHLAAGRNRRHSGLQENDTLINSSWKDAGTIFRRSFTVNCIILLLNPLSKL